MRGSERHRGHPHACVGIATVAVPGEGVRPGGEKQPGRDRIAHAGRHKKHRLPVGVAHVDIRPAGLDEHPGDRRQDLHHGEHQRTQAGVHGHGVHFGAQREQRPHGVLATHPRLNRAMKRLVTPRVCHPKDVRALASAGSRRS